MGGCEEDSIKDGGKDNNEENGKWKRTSKVIETSLKKEFKIFQIEYYSYYLSISINVFKLSLNYIAICRPT